MTALEKQGKTDEAQKVRNRLTEAWKYADIKPAVEDLYSNGTNGISTGAKME